MAAFTIVSAPLRVPDDHIATTEIAQHRGRHFSGICAFVQLMHILRAPLDCATGEFLLRLSQIRKWHTNRAIDTRHRNHPAAHRVQQLGVLSQGTVHLPVSGNQFATHRNESAKHQSVQSYLRTVEWSMKQTEQTRSEEHTLNSSHLVIS